jgi:hypothetical protein
MIVLDEQLLGRGVEEPIAAWYPGKVVFVKELRPGTVIKDEAIPSLLAQETEPTFVTINESDFWQVSPPDERYCIVCFALSSGQVKLIPVLLQRLFRHRQFDTKAKRAGRVVRITASGVAHFYEKQNSAVRPIDGF